MVFLVVDEFEVEGRRLGVRLSLAESPIIDEGAVLSRIVVSGTGLDVGIWSSAWLGSPGRCGLARLGASEARSAGVGPAACVVFEQDCFDDVFDGGLFVLVELAGGVEGEAEVVVGSAFVGVEDE